MCKLYLTGNFLPASLPPVIARSFTATKHTRREFPPSVFDGQSGPVQNVQKEKRWEEEEE